MKTHEELELEVAELRELVDALVWHSVLRDPMQETEQILLRRTKQMREEENPLTRYGSLEAERKKEKT